MSSRIAERPEPLEPPPGEGGSNRWLVLVIVCLAQFMVILDATVVNVALPSIQQDLGFSPADLQWVINGYTLVFGGFLLLGGRAGDLIGRRKVFVAGVVVFTAASLLNGLATSSEFLVASRALQGLGGALVSPAALSIITTTFAEGADRTKALGVWSAIAAGGGAFGLLLGGILTDLLSWEWIFFVNIPIGIATVALALRHVPESRAAQRQATADVPGAVTVTAGLVVLVYAIVKAEDFGWGSAETLGLAAISVALLAAFVFIESRSPAPLIRLGIFRVRSLLGANGVLLVVAGGLFAFFFFSSLYVQQILGYSPLQAGLAFLPVTAGIMVGAALAQQLVKRIGVRTVSVIGMIVAATGLLLLSDSPVDGTYAGTILPGLIPQSIGMGLTFVPVTLIATTNVGEEDAGLASGLFNTSQQVGGALGLAILSTLAADKTADVIAGGSSQPRALVDGFNVAFFAAAILIAAGALLLLLMVRRSDVANVNPDAAPVPGA
ncbi:MAG TPA: MFS transporter [Solirubrobacteraceae bacterium]|nr:MFS transporter [Solirubrobacteraceae bacterium]